MPVYLIYVFIFPLTYFKLPYLNKSILHMSTSSQCNSIRNYQIALYFAFTCSIFHYVYCKGRLTSLLLEYIVFIVGRLATSQNLYLFTFEIIEEHHVQTNKIRSWIKLPFMNTSALVWYRTHSLIKNYQWTRL